jgi:hypothetical protein
MCAAAANCGERKPTDVSFQMDGGASQQTVGTVSL